MMPSKQALAKYAPRIGGIAGWLYFATILITFFPYISALFFAGLLVFAPSVALAGRKRSRQNVGAILRRRLLATGIALGLLALMLFPNVARVPTQVVRRLNRGHTLITPQDPLVISFRDTFLAEQGGHAGWTAKPLADRFTALNEYVQRKVIWTEDLVTRGMAGDLATPAEAIALGRDDCRGQAAVTVSVLISMGYDACVAEMPWHTFTLVYVAGVEYKVNHLGHTGRTVQYPILLIWNDTTVRYWRDPLGTFAVTMDTHPNFYAYLDAVGWLLPGVGVLLGIGTALYASACHGDHRGILQRAPPAMRRFKRRLLAGILGGLSIVGTLVLLRVSPLEGAGGIWVFIAGLALLATALNVEEVNEWLGKGRPTSAT